MNETLHMRQALELARTAQGKVSPRPAVGAVVVSDDGVVIGSGRTQPSPGPHAEVAALRSAGPAAAGATMFVTLEPCSHTGATPPCADAIIDAGVRRVVAAMRDPNPKVRGRGFARLRSSGIEVRTGTLRRRAAEVVEPFTSWITTGRPLVTMKLAATLDGKLAAPDGTSRWITGPQAREQVHELRATADAVLVGAGTVLTDDPALTCRLPGFAGPQPMRVVLDSSGRTPPGARVMDGRAPCVMITTEAAPGTKRRDWEAAGARVVCVPRSEQGAALGPALDALGELEICHVLAEPGPTLASSLVAEGLASRIILYLAPKLLGGSAPGLLADGPKTLSEAFGLQVVSVGRVGEDLRIDARLRGST